MLSVVASSSETAIALSSSIRGSAGALDSKFSSSGATVVARLLSVVASSSETAIALSSSIRGSAGALDSKFSSSGATVVARLLSVVASSSETAIAFSNVNNVIAVSAGALHSKFSETVSERSGELDSKFFLGSLSANSEKTCTCTLYCQDLPSRSDIKSPEHRNSQTPGWK